MTRLRWPVLRVPQAPGRGSSAARRSAWGARGASLALVTAAALFASALHRALRIEPVAEPSAPGPASPPATIARRPGTDEATLLAAIEAGPFHPERHRPTVAFRLPGEAAADARDVRGASGEVRLLGTAVLPGGRAFAMLEWPGEAPKVVHIGETVGGFTLKTVERGRATLVSAGGTTLEVQVPKAGT